MSAQLRCPWCGAPIYEDKENVGYAGFGTGPGYIHVCKPAPSSTGNKEEGA